MFKKLTKCIVNEMDPSKEMVPVESIAHQEHFRPLYLLIEKRKSNHVFHPAPYYERTGFTLDHVLLPGGDGKSIESLHQDSSPFTLTKTSTDQADGGLSISVDPASVGLQGAASLSNVFSIKTQKKSISRDSLEALRREREINMNHSFIRQLRQTDFSLFVVTEILEASEDVVYTESTTANGGLKAKFVATVSAKGTRENNQSIAIPKGCTLAFNTIPLQIRDGAWELDYFRRGDYIIASYEGPSQGNLGVVLIEVENHCQIFSKLSPDVLLIILNTIKAVMGDNNLLQELSHKMEDILEKNDGYELKSESTKLQALFSTLQHFRRGDLLLLAEGITYVLDALHELMEDQLLLLLESLERKIVSQQLKLVGNLLKHDLEYRMENFRVDAGLLSFPHAEDQKLTIALVELSGVQLQEDGSAVPTDQPFEAVAALFVALYALNLLSGSE
ncbi:gasdermin-A3-like [Prinia subflava]|uniref:gasdermin-A3-like n=1 Tax=Prinia subflava TaxID=208062 RepID=UPI002FE3E08C